MDNFSSFLKLGRAALFALLCATTGSAFATATFGTRVDSYCATQPAQASAPQQSRPYRAEGFSCGLCHTNPSAPTINNLNAFGSASLSCNGITCGAAVNPFCVAHAPSNATITAPAAGATVTQGQSLTFTASTPTNPDGFPLTFTWMFTGGMPNATGQSISVPMTVAGSITSTLQVRNSVGMPATGTPPTRTVTVTGGGGANQPPVASISMPSGSVTVAQGGTVTFQGSGSDPDGNTPLTYNWNFGGGAPNSTQQNPGAVTFNTAGTFTVAFTVTDSLGLASAPVTRTVTVTGGGANQPPVATITAPAGSVTVAQGGTVTFQGSGSDPDGNTPLTYNWNFGGGAPNSTQQNPGAVTFNTAGTFSVTFTVTDSLGLASTPVTRTVTVTAPQPPQPDAPVAAIVAPAGNVTVAQGGTVTFRGIGTAARETENGDKRRNGDDGEDSEDRNRNGDDNGDGLTLRYNWNFGGGAPNSTQQNPGAVRFNAAGVFTVTFTVTDSRGRVSAPVTRIVTVTAPANQPPVASITEPDGNVAIAQGGTVSFRGTGSDPDGNTPLTYNWNFGGGAPDSTQQNPGAVTFNTAGTFTITFTVTDSLGLASAPVTRMVTVAAPVNQPPVASITAPSGNVTVTQGGTVTFRGSGNDPDGNTPLAYNWSFGGGAPDSMQQNPGAVTFNTVGVFTVTFTVTDSLGLASAPVTRTVTVTGVTDPTPTAAIITPAINVSVLPGGTVMFSGAGTSPVNQRLRYRWRFPAGKPAVSVHRIPGAVRFGAPGSYTVTLTVTDRSGRTATASRVITVAKHNHKPRLTEECQGAATTDGGGQND